MLIERGANNARYLYNRERTMSDTYRKGSERRQILIERGANNVRF